MLALSIVIIPTMLILLVVFTLLRQGWDRQEFIGDNRLLIQEAVREQCSMNDYVADGYFDDSLPIPLPYYDSVAGNRIDCNMINESWQCECDEINTP
jgi:hypothetical protein